MRVLIHLSHHKTGTPDGWSGAPGEAVWVQDLVGRIRTKLAVRGVFAVVVDGDLLDHIQFHEDYDAFIAPHYEANVHTDNVTGAPIGGSFWGRAFTSTTPAKDDALGVLFWTKYKALAGKPPDRFNWSNPNVTDYYGFRLTTANTPGILVEHGVGAPGAPDFQWLRDNIDAIAQVWADALFEFGGVVVPAPVPVPSPVMTDAEFKEKYDRLIAPGLKSVLEGTDAGASWDNGGIKGVLNTHVHESKSSGPKKP